MNLAKRIWRDEKAQGMTEYIIIVCLIAIAAIVVVKLFGAKIIALFEGAGDKLDRDVKPGTR